MPVHSHNKRLRTLPNCILIDGQVMLCSRLIRHPAPDRHRCLLVPRRDMEAHGLSRDIDSDVMLSAWFDGIPLRDLAASIVVRFIFLLSRPI